MFLREGLLTPLELELTLLCVLAVLEYTYGILATPDPGAYA